MTTQSIIEIVARAIARDLQRQLLEHGGSKNGADLDNASLARSAIEAMKTPTPAMLAAGQKHHWGRDYPESSDEDEATNCAMIYTAMLTTALDQPSE